MILKHAIRYLELTGSDFITDLKDFADLQKSFVAGYIPLFILLFFFQVYFPGSVLCVLESLSVYVPI